MLSNFAGIGIIGIRQHDHADLVIQLNQGLSQITWIASAMAHIQLVAGLAHRKTDRIAARPIVLHHADSMHFTQRAGRQNRRPCSELQRHESSHVFDVGSKAGRRAHRLRVDEWQPVTMSIGHPPAIANRQLWHLFVEAG